MGLSLYKQSFLGRSFRLDITFSYSGIIKEYIENFKFYRDLSAGKELVNLLLEHIDLSTAVDIIVPVPSHILDNIIRGYETMSYLTYILSKKLDIEYVQVLRKSFWPLISRTQKRKTRINRIKTTNTFLVRSPKLVKNKRILLFDDIWTTGSTVRKLVDLLYYYGAESVSVLEIALA